MSLRIKLYIIIAHTLIAVQISVAQVKVAFLNTRNLYDTINNPVTNDGEFTPTGRYKWNTADYNAKIDKLARYIKSINPDIIGLCEVENREVVQDLVFATDYAYKIIHYDSRDTRGIDIALLYRPTTPAAQITITQSEIITPPTPTPTREILQTSFTINNTPITIYTLHMPSKLGGKKALENRKAIIAHLETLIPQSTNTIIMGDMNDASITVRSMINITAALVKKGLGTYCYRGVWSMLDQILVSPSLEAKSSIPIIATPPRNPYRTKSYDPDIPSDHLAVYFILEL